MYVEQVYEVKKNIIIIILKNWGFSNYCFWIYGEKFD